MAYYVDVTDLSQLRHAIRETRKIAIAYLDEEGRRTERTIVGAWCQLRRDFRHFRVDRDPQFAGAGRAVYGSQRQAHCRMAGAEKRPGGRPRLVTQHRRVITGIAARADLGHATAIRALFFRQRPNTVPVGAWRGDAELSEATEKNLARSIAGCDAKTAFKAGPSLVPRSAAIGF
jgi:hypothetical protein